MWLGGRLQFDKTYTNSLHTVSLIQFFSSARDRGIVLDPMVILSLIRSTTFPCPASTIGANSVPFAGLSHFLLLPQKRLCTRVDSGNALYSCLSFSNTPKLQSILNDATRLIGVNSKTGSYFGLYPGLISLLPIHSFQMLI